jgi:A/G-specific adenine glycosylase
MLQQTQVATVIPYFERFLQVFPTLAHLARADEQEVLRQWEGLGYYRRARDLHRAARRLADEHDGRLLNDPAVWRELPGVGRYMLGAVLSQAFDRCLPIVEANSARVLCRLFAQSVDPSTSATRKWLWQTAERLLPQRRVGDFNQALMEVGALVCTAAGPRCAACPVAFACLARQRGLQHQIPTRTARPAVVEVHESAVIVRRGAHVLLVQRPPAGRWAGMWEFPHGVRRSGESPAQAAVRLAAELAGIAVTVRAELATVRHSVTHHRITLACFEARRRRGSFCSGFYQRAAWVKPKELQAYPVSAPQRRLAQRFCETLLTG